MSLINQLLAQGFVRTTDDPRSSVGPGTYVCPQPSCGLEICPTRLREQRDGPRGDAVTISSFAEFSEAVAARRGDLGVWAIEVDEAAGLSEHHTGKTERSGHRSKDRARGSRESIAHLALIATRDNSPEARTAQREIVAATLVSPADLDSRRSPTLDSVLLMVEALGGSITISWGEPHPALARQIKRRENDN